MTRAELLREIITNPLYNGNVISLRAMRKDELEKIFSRLKNDNEIFVVSVNYCSNTYNKIVGVFRSQQNATKIAEKYALTLYESFKTEHKSITLEKENDKWLFHNYEKTFASIKIFKETIKD